MNTRVLVVDDDEEVCKLVQAAMQPHAISVVWRTDPSLAIEATQHEDFDVVVTDLNMAQLSGLELCQAVTESRPDVPVIVITAFGSMDSAIAAIRAGAYDFINKPIEMAALAHAIGRAAQHRRLTEEVKVLRQEVRSAARIGDLLGESRPIRRIYDLIRRIGSADAAVLITGESGTGKELVARALHKQSEREAAPFIAINCAAVPAQLLESELFGHVKGAFTDARTSRKGLFEQAEGGTLLLDEIGEMPLELQPKLLRVLQERTVRPVGGGTEVPFDVRVIATTNRDLEAEVEAERFREDLYYRLNVVQIHLPPLRARGNDILLLAQYFTERFAAEQSKQVTGISAPAATKLLEYHWPGNVRQLENCMERAVTLTRFETLNVDDLPEKIRTYESARISLPDEEHVLTLAELERRYIERVLKLMDGNKTQAARTLGLDRRTLYRKLERYEKSNGAQSNVGLRSLSP